MDPTDAQSKRVKEWRGVFGRDVVKEHAPDSKTGIMRVTLQSMAGTHEWFIDQTGTLVDSYLSARLFDPPAQQAKPRNAIDN